MYQLLSRCESETFRACSKQSLPKLVCFQAFLQQCVAPFFSDLRALGQYASFVSFAIGSFQAK